MLRRMNPILPTARRPDLRRRRLLGASVIWSPVGLIACATASPPRSLPPGLREGTQQAWHLPASAVRTPIDDTPYDRLQIAVPAGYSTSTRPWPLLVFLHGAGERGLDVDDVKRGGPPLRIEQGAAYPMIVCSPQTDPGTRWQPRRLHALVAALQARFAIDPRRVLATGLSLGGSGVWRWACEFPDDLAAIAPVCGFGDPAAVPAMRRVAVRAYHGELDPLVPLARQQACIAEMKRVGGSAELTVYPGVGHDSWTAAYEDPGLVRWLLAQSRA
jgi:predicted peptidase